MLIAKMNLHSAHDGHTEKLVEVHITNDATGTPHRGNYDWVVVENIRGNVSIRRGRVEDWDRSRAASLLLAEVLALAEG